MKDAGCAIIGLLLWGSAVADPTPEVARLMREPISMLDWGLDHMSLMLTQTAEHRLKDYGITSSSDMAYVVAQYDYSANRIKVRETFGPGVLLAVPAKDACRKVLIGLREDLGYTEGNPQPLTVWTEFFRHAGFSTDSKADAELSVELPKMVSIEVLFIKPGGLRVVHCSGNLTDRAISFTE